MRRNTIAILLACITTSAAAQERATPQPTVSVLPSITLPPDLDRVLRDYEREWRAGNAAGLGQLFTEDGFVTRPAGWIRGRSGIVQAYSIAGGDLRLRALAYAADDTVGYIIGGYKYGEQPADAQDNGKFVLALRRQPGGRWLIAADIDAPNRPPQR